VIFWKFKVLFKWEHLPASTKKFTAFYQVDAFLEELETNAKRINKVIDYSVVRI